MSLEISKYNKVTFNFYSAKGYFLDFVKNYDNCTIDVITKDLGDLIENVGKMDSDFEIDTLSKIIVEF